MDFGAGREQREGPRRSLAGTPLYLAPEVLSRSERVQQSSPTSTAWGSCCSFCSPAPIPCPGGISRACARRTRAANAPPLKTLRPGLPHRLRTVIERAIEPDPGRRYLDAAGSRLRSAGTRVLARLEHGGVVLGAAAAALFLAAWTAWGPVAKRRGPWTVRRSPSCRSPHPGTDSDDRSFADGLTWRSFGTSGWSRISTSARVHRRWTSKGTQQNLVEVGRRAARGLPARGVRRAGGRAYSCHGDAS